MATVNNSLTNVSRFDYFDQAKSGNTQKETNILVIDVNENETIKVGKILITKLKKAFILTNLN